MSDDSDPLGLVKDIAQQTTQTVAEAGNFVGGTLGDISGYNDRYSPAVSQATMDAWQATITIGAIPAGMDGAPLTGGTGSGLRAAWFNFYNQLWDAYAVAAEQGAANGADYSDVTKGLAAAQANAVMRFVFNAKLNGPVKSAGTGFSFGSPVFHVVVIPFGDAELTPLCWLS